MDFSTQRDRTLVLKSERQIRQFFLENIVFIQAYGHFCHVNLANAREPELFSEKIGVLSEQLRNAGFVCIKRDVLLNLRY